MANPSHAGSDAALKRTPLNSLHRELGAKMVPFGGWDMPLDYGSQIEEHLAVRASAGLFDVSHMGQIRFRGQRAIEYLTRLVPGNIGRLADGESLYTTLCTESGGIVDDLIISRVGPHEGFAVVNAGTKQKDFEWMLSQREKLDFADVEITDESDDWAMIALQGPKALAIADEQLGGKKWSETKAFTLHNATIDGAACLISRTGYTGEDGVEILCPPKNAEAIWRRLMAAGARPIGLGARDSLRLEMGYPLYGNDLNETISPLEGGIGWTVSLKKPESFIGRAALEQQKASGPLRERVGLRLDSRRPIRRGDQVSDGTKNIGEVTSGGYSPTLGAGIALALVDRVAAEGKSELSIVSRGTELKAKVVKPPFVVKQSN